MDRLRLLGPKQMSLAKYQAPGFCLEHGDLRERRMSRRTSHLHELGVVIFSSMRRMAGILRMLMTLGGVYLWMILAGMQNLEDHGVLSRRMLRVRIVMLVDRQVVRHIKHPHQ